MIPYQQGKLDGLCGVYSMINATRIINHFNYAYCQDIFAEIIAFLALECSLSKITTQGINFSMIGQIITQIRSLNLSKERPVFEEKEPTLADFWSSMAHHLAQPSRAILLGMGNVYDHWTVVHRITEKRIMLFDSGHLKYLNKCVCTTQNPDQIRRHLIMPRRTYYLRSKGVKRGQ